jgi:hypothetical protein
MERDVIGQEFDELLPHIEDDLRTGAFEMATKNSAYIQGIQAAQQYLLHTIAITEQEWKMLAEQYASGHLSSPPARRHFEQGWLTVSPATFAQGDQVVLQVRIMNIHPELLEKEMYELFGPYSTIAFQAETKICLTYRLETACIAVNWLSQSAFLRRKQISYKIIQEV